METKNKENTSVEEIAIALADGGLKLTL